MNDIEGLSIKIFADGADLNQMLEGYQKGIVSGFTTNPTLMKKAGVVDYKEFAHEFLKAIPNLPISFEVFSDDFEGMEREARIIAGWGENVFVKIPVTNTEGKSTGDLIKKLSYDGLKLNVTAILTTEQVKNIVQSLSQETPCIISVFAGRIADTGRDPGPIMKECANVVSINKNIELLWASSRELLNLFQAQECGCKIITVTPEILNKIKMIGKDLNDLSLDTVKMFYEDAHNAGYII